MKIYLEGINEDVEIGDGKGIIIKSDDAIFVIRELSEKRLTIVNPAKIYQLDHVVRQIIEPYDNGCFTLTQWILKPPKQVNIVPMYHLKSDGRLIYGAVGVGSVEAEYVQDDPQVLRDWAKERGIEVVEDFSTAKIGADHDER